MNLSLDSKGSCQEMSGTRARSEYVSFCYIIIISKLSGLKPPQFCGLAVSSGLGWLS